ncbi:hypothetical protein HY798_05055 [Candidatus Falkowbacteria bacterium]|nr:hypothetical protein [Candidatus Falkowbacteria bacterium]
MKELSRQQRMEIWARVKNGEPLREILINEYPDYEFALVIKTEPCKRGGPESHPFRSGPVIEPTKESIHNAYFTRKEAEGLAPRTPTQLLEHGCYCIDTRSIAGLSAEYADILYDSGGIGFILTKLQENLWPPYIENPKTKGSGIVCCIPQTGRCPMKCKDCFFQSGRSYLEPLDENLPNMPDPDWVEENEYIVRVNDGNDSNNRRELVIESAKPYKKKFYNTSIPKDLENFDAPVVLTINPAQMTDTKAYLLDPIPKNLMFVRVRVDAWNIELVKDVVTHYCAREVPIVLTFMAYYSEKEIPKRHRKNYILRKRTLNSYCAITTAAWVEIMSIFRFKYNRWVYSCGKIEGEMGTTACRHCGNCLREYFATMERTRNEE